MELPQIGIGTWELRGEECTKIVRMALEIGYRHIDTSHDYQNHKAIHKAIKGFDRHALYITSKLDIDEEVQVAKVGSSVRKACERALKELGTDYLDLYLIHWPIASFPLEEIFLALTPLKEEGKILHAGVSNYTIHHLEDLRRAGGAPFANQVEFHPHLYQKELLDYCRFHGIQLVAFRPFGKGKLLQAEPLLEQIGAMHHKTAAQVVLRWLIQKEIPVIPKASSEKHLRANLDVFDFVLSQEEMGLLDHLSVSRRYCEPDSPVYTY